MAGNLPAFVLSSLSFIEFCEEPNQLSGQIQAYPLESSCLNTAVAAFGFIINLVWPWTFNLNKMFRKGICNLGKESRKKVRKGKMFFTV